jgi:Ca2+-transporting ATPase
MGAAELWTCDSSFYSFTESTKLDPDVGCVNQVTQSPTDPKEKSETQVPKTLDSMSVHLVASMMTATLCNNSTIYKDAETKTWKTTGDPTEVLLIFLAYPNR